MECSTSAIITINWAFIRYVHRWKLQSAEPRAEATGTMPDSVPELVGPSLERICEAASGRKFTKLRHEAKVRSCFAELQSATCQLFLAILPCSLDLLPLSKLMKHNVQQMLTNLEEVFRPPPEAHQPAERRKVVLHIDNSIEGMAQAEKKRLAALMAEREQQEQQSQQRGSVQDVTDTEQTQDSETLQASQSLHEEGAQPSLADSATKSPTVQAGELQGRDPYRFQCFSRQHRKGEQPSSLPCGCCWW